jgi:ATP/maltotriose-dependent transcriptional regulator MalT
MPAVPDGDSFLAQPCKSSGGAKRFTGAPASAMSLEDLYQRHLFTHRRPGKEPTYWYHALFRELFAGSSQAVFWSEGQRRELQRQAGELLDREAAHLEAAIRYCCVQGQGWQACRKLSS